MVKAMPWARIRQFLSWAQQQLQGQQQSQGPQRPQQHQQQQGQGAQQQQATTIYNYNNHYHAPAFFGFSGSQAPTGNSIPAMPGENRRPPPPHHPALFDGQLSQLLGPDDLDQDLEVGEISPRSSLL